MKLNKLSLLFVCWMLGSTIASAKNRKPNGATDSNETVTASEQLKLERDQVGVKTFTSADYKPVLLKHIVLFRYSSTVTPEQKNEVAHKFLALKKLAKRNGKNYIVSIDFGNQNSGEGAGQNLQAGFIVTFRSEGDRNYYVGTPVVTDASDFDPAHQAFKDFVGPLLDKNGALVFDFALNHE